ncbi:hypothetical protein [Reyranella sp.]|uniref:hypothetical protein n=1 Tax=Reyranella sp. TaxID=1929291 RepID=UPI003D09E7C5
MAFRHDDASGYRIDVAVSDQRVSAKVLVIETNLELDPNAPEYDSSKVNDLLKAGYDFVRDPKNKLDLVRLSGTLKA